MTMAAAERVLEVFEHLHAHPEISWKEFETTTYITRMLKDAGCRVRVMDQGLGVIGDLGEGGPIVGVRADLDALWQEVDGEFRANHSCGHDGHMSIAAGVLMLLKQNPPKGTVRFIFQPAEEKGQGALAMIDQGALDGVSWLYGVHLRPIFELPRGKASAVILHGASGLMSGKVSGDDAHGAHPHRGTNAIEVCSALVQALHSIRVTPLVPHSVKMTRLQAGGESFNIIPGNASFALDIRAQTNEVFDALFERVTSCIKAVSIQYGVDIDYELKTRIVAPRRDAVAERLMRNAIAAILGDDGVVDSVTTPGGEDFHYYSVKLPELHGTMLGLGCNLSPGLHHPHMTFDRDALFEGSQILANVVHRTFQRLGA